LEQQFGALPGVQSVELALYSTLEGNNWGEGVRVGRECQEAGIWGQLFRRPKNTNSESCTLDHRYSLVPVFR
jgi:hypothetical protein